MNNEIISSLKKARKAKKLSQRELSKRIGIPQSHISKIEGGHVDIRLSNLTQIARALDLEIQLVPRKALPAVRTIVRSTKPSIGHITALEKIQNAQQTIDKFSQFSNKLEGISKLNKTLDSLKYFSYPNNQLERLSEQLNPINRISKLMSQIQTKQKSLVDATKYQNLLTQSVQSLSIFRNELAHNTENLTAVSKPAYTLEDEDE